MVVGQRGHRGRVLVLPIVWLYAMPSKMMQLELQEFRSCNLTCRLNGRWSKWSEWSPCSPSCHRFRTRTCTSPPPINGGHPCVGKELETVVCSEE
ncbi:unnamed protein product [Strongylus vulgaris]|uniref:Uncharacterized protein n=1 Tax=Strongylus vulgaris TaxID=40348 RepID=A0A3P7JCQ1_STRVU|nr:unnamed protein product [Strongylus vulgaris]